MKLSKPIIVLVVAVIALAIGVPRLTRLMAARWEPQFDDAFRASDEAIGPSRQLGSGFRRELLSDCSATPPVDHRPTICVVQTDKRSYRKGGRLRLKLRWWHVPQGSSIVVSLIRDDPTSRGFDYLGQLGPLTMQSFPASGSSGTTVVWDGRGFASAADDAPSMLEVPAEIGRYRLLATLLDGPTVTVVGMVLAPASTPRPKLLAYHASLPFIITGKPDLSLIASSLVRGAVEQIPLGREARIRHGRNAGPIDERYEKLPPVYQRFGNRLCAQVPLRPGYTGDVEACVSRRALVGEAGLLRISDEDVHISGRVSPTAGMRPDG